MGRFKLFMIFTENVHTPPFTSGLSRTVRLEVETDALLLESARKMDKEALVRIFDLYSTSLYNYALRLCQDPLTADQIVGDVFAKFLEQLSMGRGPETHLRAYLYQMTYHLVVDDARYSSRRTSLDALDLNFHEEPAFLSAEKRLTFEAVQHAMRTSLTDIQRHVVILRFLEGMNIRETARILGKSEDHVKVIQSRAIKALRKALQVSLN